jgi:hypothetical protein
MDPVSAARARRASSTSTSPAATTGTSTWTCVASLKTPTSGVRDAGAVVDAVREPAWMRRAAALGWCPPEARWLSDHYAAVSALEVLLGDEAVAALPHDIRHLLTERAEHIVGAPVTPCSCRPSLEQAALW